MRMSAKAGMLRGVLMKTGNKGRWRERLAGNATGGEVDYRYETA
jgi:hypothetical protein